MSRVLTPGLSHVLKKIYVWSGISPLVYHILWMLPCLRSPYIGQPLERGLFTATDAVFGWPLRLHNSLRFNVDRTEAYVSPLGLLPNPEVDQVAHMCVAMDKHACQ